MTYLVTYLVAEFDGRGCSRIRHDLHVVKSTKPILAVARWAARGFVNQRGNFVMPAAILMVSEAKGPGGREV